MAFLDVQNTFADDGALGTSTGTANFGDVIDLGEHGANYFGDLNLQIEITEDLTSGGAATVQFQLVSSDSSTIPTDGTQTVHLITKQFDYGDIVAGDGESSIVFLGRLPAMGYKRYLGVQQVVGTAALTGGNASAFLTRSFGAWVATPNQYTV